MTNSWKLRSAQRAIAGLASVTIVMTSVAFPVVAQEAPAGSPAQASAAATKTEVSLDSPAKTDAAGAVTVPVTATGFTKGAALTAKIDGTPVKFAEGRSDQVDTKAVGEDGVFAQTVAIPAGIAPAGTHTLTLSSDNKDDAEATVEIVTNPGFKLSDDTLYKSVPLGEDYTVTLTNLPAGTVVNGVSTGSTELAKGEVTADESGTADVQISVPADQELVTSPLRVQYLADNNGVTFDPGITVTTSRTPEGEELFTIAHAKVPTGAYETAINKETGFGFGTSAVGRPPIDDTQLYKFDADTLEIVGSVTPEEAPNGGRYAVYGVGLDNEHGTVWVTNTRQATVAVYRQDDLSLVKQFQPDEVAHSRDVVVDPAIHRAYVTSGDRANPDKAKIRVYDTETLEPVGTVDLAAAFPETKGAMMSLSLDPETGELFSTNMAGSQAFKIDGRKITDESLSQEGAEERAAAPAYRENIDVYQLGDVSEPSGVAWNPKARQLYIASQGSDDLTVLDVDSGKVIKRIPTGARALSAVYEPETNIIYVANRSGGTVTAIDADKLEVIATLDGGKYPNHITVGEDGQVYLLNKAKNTGEDGKEFDDLYRYQLKKAEEKPADKPAEETGKPADKPATEATGSSEELPKPEQPKLPELPLPKLEAPQMAVNAGSSAEFQTPKVELPTTSSEVLPELPQVDLPAGSSAALDSGFAAGQAEAPAVGSSVEGLFDLGLDEGLSGSGALNSSAFGSLF